MLGKRLHFCCTRLKRPSQTNPQQSPNPPCVPSSSSSSSSSTSSLFKNFNSLYDPTAASDSETLTTGFGSGSGSTSQTLTSILTADDNDDAASSDSEPDLSTVIASGRLLRPASTGRSNSIVEEESGEGSGSGSGSGLGLGSGFGAVPKLSPDPYGDFKRSMEEMVAALGLTGEGEGGDHQGEHVNHDQLLRGSGAQRQQQLRLQELLLCYLALNRKNAHKYIVGAFVDLLRTLSSASNNNN